jgi:hypothetical protein
VSPIPNVRCKLALNITKKEGCREGRRMKFGNQAIHSNQRKEREKERRDIRERRKREKR